MKTNDSSTANGPQPPAEAATPEDALNSLYWAYNLPLQLWPSEGGDEARIVNYMPRKEQLCDLALSDAMGEQTREEFFEQAALCLENMAHLFRQAKTDTKLTIYYHDEGMES